MPAQARPPQNGFSTCRVGWTLCLLACGAFIVDGYLTYARERAWSAAVQSESLRYAWWAVVAHREAWSVIGDVEGLTREQVAERLASRLGPDDPYPSAVTAAGWVMSAPFVAQDPLREPPVLWGVRRRNWNVIVPIYGGRAQNVHIDTLKTTFSGPRLPRGHWEIRLHTTLYGSVIVLVTAFASGALWWLRLNHRAAIHACLMVAALGSVALISYDWDMGTGLRWRPLAFGGKWSDVPWQGPASGLVFGLIALRVPPRRPSPGLCPSCRYDLTGNVSGTCPECGKAIIPPAAAPRAASPDVRAGD